MAESSALEVRKHREEERQHRIDKEAAIQLRWEREQETRKQDRLDDKQRAEEAARTRKDEREADQAAAVHAAAQAKEERDHAYRMLLLQSNMQQNRAGRDE